jgi:hydroxymethylglutaryl-CoA synthase
MVFSGVIQPEYIEVVKDMELEREIGERRKITMEEYENLHRREKGINEHIISPHKEFVLVRVGKSGTTEGFREYTFVN